ncbi:MAG: cysteine desulfurase [Candidatus Bathyarchaeota archaeon]|nr:MAG: cysteine desulfurase [Candidatus Bathyarchaeota archaeon]
MRKLYVDYAATTPLDPKVFKAMKPYFTEMYGNASSIHSYGIEAKQAIAKSRKIVAELLTAEPEELIFTGSATEANNTALKGHAFKQGKEKASIAISSIEHDCVLNTAIWLEQQGYRVTTIPVDKYGLLKLEELKKALRKSVSLVSIIHANNEIGTIQPLKEIGNLCHEHNALFHTDAAQSFGKIPINVKKMNIDLMTINAHKIYGPKGVGALYVRKGVEIDPLLHGGGHEFGLRSSTENVPGIVGFAKAVELRKKEMGPEATRLRKLKNHLVKEILNIEDTYLNGHPKKNLPNIANFRFSYIEGESLLLLLDKEGIAASTGSACSSATGKPSHVLSALGIKPEELHGSLRLSLGKKNTQADIDYILNIIPKIVKRLRSISPIKKIKTWTSQHNQKI